MLQSHFLVAWRNFRHNRVFSFINIVGLAIGISATLVIFLIVQYEFSFDKFENGRDRIYRIVTTTRTAGSVFYNSGVPSPLTDAVTRDLPGVELIVGFHEPNALSKVTVHPDGSKAVVFRNLPKVIFTDKSYFDLIHYLWLVGSPEHALEGENKIVLSDVQAARYFPGKKPEALIGKQVIYDDSIILTVSGIVGKSGDHTDFDFNEFVCQSVIRQGAIKDNYRWDDWHSVNSGSQLFLRLKPGVKVRRVEAQLALLLKKYSKDPDPDEKSGTIFSLQPMNDLHFNSTFYNFGDHTAHLPTLYGLLTIAAFLLLLACINFVNLTTAQGSKRAKEIGIRKTLGGSRKQLVLQFLQETFFITTLATLLSVIITPLLLTVFADFIPRDLHFNLLHQPLIIAFLLILTVLVSLLSGFYPALVLSGFKPVQVLKNQAVSGRSKTRSATLRKGLTVSQFFIAQVFVMATLITIKQIHYMLNKDIGLKKEAIINFMTPFDWSNYSKPDPRRLVLRNKLNTIPGIELVSLSDGPPSSNGWATQSMSYTDGKKTISAEVNIKSGDTNFLRLYHIRLLAGRNVEPSDTTKEYVVNEKFMHLMGFQHPADILNKQIVNIPVVGVMSDFNQQSLHTPVKPLVYTGSAVMTSVFSIALTHANNQGIAWTSTISQIREAFKSIYPEDNFSYEFFDESIAKFYKSENNISRLLKWATGLAIFISCMGMLGLVIFTTNQRTKEIGVRKVLGASVANIVSILSKDFIRLVCIAFVVAIPMAWWAMSRWLNNFAYRTAISWWLFILTGAGMMLIALITLSIQTIRAARANPVESLRNE